MSFWFEVEGIEDSIQGFNEKISKISEACKKEIIDVCLDLQGKAQRIAPIKEGFLRASGNTEFKEERDIFYGEVGFNESYALEQHENLTFKHPKGGQAKYLEFPFIENKDLYLQNIKNSMKGVV